MSTVNDASVMGYDAMVACAVRMFKSGLNAFMVLGPPGNGKTSLRVGIAKALGYQHIFMIKAAHHDVVDFAGVPVPNEEDKRTYFYASADMLPASDLTGGVLVVFDEAGDCNIQQQNLLCQAVFEMRLHNYEFPNPTKFLLTSNRVADRSGANRIVTKLGNRIGTGTLRTTPDEFFMHGALHGFNPSVLAFVKQKGLEMINPSDKRGEDAPTYFNSFDPADPAQMANPQFASSRSYEFASDYLNYVDANEPGLDEGTLISELATILGTSVASTLVAYRKIAITMPDPQKILDGKPIPYPTKQEVLWALTLTLASRADKKSLAHVHAFLDKGPPEYLALMARIVYDTKMPGIVGPALHAMISDPKLKSMFSDK